MLRLFKRFFTYGKDEKARNETAVARLLKNDELGGKLRGNGRNGKGRVQLRNATTLKNMNGSLMKQLHRYLDNEYLHDSKNPSYKVNKKVNNKLNNNREVTLKIPFKPSVVKTVFTALKEISRVRSKNGITVEQIGDCVQLTLNSNVQVTFPPSFQERLIGVVDVTKISPNELITWSRYENFGGNVTNLKALIEFDDNINQEDQKRIERLYTRNSASIIELIARINATTNAFTMKQLMGDNPPIKERLKRMMQVAMTAYLREESKLYEDKKLTDVSALIRQHGDKIIKIKNGENAIKHRNWQQWLQQLARQPEIAGKKMNAKQAANMINTNREIHAFFNGIGSLRYPVARNNNSNNIYLKKCVWVYNFKKLSSKSKNGNQGSNNGGNNRAKSGQNNNKVGSLDPWMKQLSKYEGFSNELVEAHQMVILTLESILEYYKQEVAIAKENTLNKNKINNAKQGGNNGGNNNSMTGNNNNNVTSSNNRATEKASPNANSIEKNKAKECFELCKQCELQDHPLFRVCVGFPILDKDDSQFTKYLRLLIHSDQSYSSSGLDMTKVVSGIARGDVKFLFLSNDARGSNNNTDAVNNMRSELNRFEKPYSDSATLRLYAWPTLRESLERYKLL
jgi:hypothetical protein